MLDVRRAYSEEGVTGISDGGRFARSLGVVAAMEALMLYATC